MQDAATREPEIPVTLPCKTSSHDEKLPENFDSRNEWLGCGQYVVNQGQCGDCFAASAANTLGDRACVHLKGDGSAIGLPRGGAGGAGAVERMFQISGRCIGKGEDGLAHQHGCQRFIEFPSPQKLVSCGNQNITARPTRFAEQADYAEGQSLYPSSSGCNGGEARDAWRYFYHEGLSTMDLTQLKGCTPYTSDLCSGADPNNNGCHTCAGFDQCADTGKQPTVITVDSWGWIMEQDLPKRAFTGVARPFSQSAAMERQVMNMQIEMHTNGPLHVCIDDFANFGDFFNYHASGIYNSTEGTPKTGGHCIEVVGWGVDRLARMAYWTFKNSWSRDWANSGFARWVRGVDLCGIESDVWVGCPSNSDCKLTPSVVHWEALDPNIDPQNVSTWTPTRSPSRDWPGGKELELTHDAFSHQSVAPVVVAAVRKARQEPSLAHDEALAAASRVWSKSARGLRVRVDVGGLGDRWVAHRDINGAITSQWL
jgi:hypothetical protein